MSRLMSDLDIGSRPAFSLFSPDEQLSMVSSRNAKDVADKSHPYIFSLSIVTTDKGELPIIIAIHEIFVHAMFRLSQIQFLDAQ